MNNAKKACIILGIFMFSGQFVFDANCQYWLDVKVEQKPFDYAKFFELDKKNPVKSISYFVKRYYKNSLIKTDTIYKECLTKQGDRLSFVTYRENKPSGVSNYIYSQNEKALERSIKELIQKDQSYVTKLIKNKEGKDLLNYQASIINGDTTTRTYTKFFYNSDSELIKKSVGGNKRGTSAIIYEYLDHNMVLAKSYYDASNLGFYLAVAYKYNSQHLPVEKRAYSVRNGKPDTPALFSHYNYDNGLLIKETYEGYNEKAKKVETKIDYSYNSNQQLIQLHASKDTLYKKVVYEYDGSRLKKHTIHTNTKFGLNGDGIVYPDTPAGIPFTLEFIFEYDSFGNLITTKEFLNDQIYMEKTMKLTYY